MVAHQERAHSNKTRWLLLCSTNVTFCISISLDPMGTSPPVRWYTKTRLTQEHWTMAASTVFFSWMMRPPRTPWSAVTTVSAWAVGSEDRTNWSAVSLFLFEHVGSEGRTNSTTECWAVILHNSHKNDEKVWILQQNAELQFCITPTKKKEKKKERLNSATDSR